MALTARQRDRRNLAPHKAAVAAMWLYSGEYASQNGGCMDFWDKLPDWKKRNCRDLVKDVEKAETETVNA